MKSKLLAAAGLAASLAASPAAALIVIGTGASGVDVDENLLFTNNPPPGLEIEGITNNTGTLVDITGGEVLYGSGGQARVRAQADNRIDTPFTYQGVSNQLLGFDFDDASLAFSDAVFRVFVGRGTATSLTITAFDTLGTQFQQTLAIPRSGFFNLTTLDNQLIDRFSIAANGSIEDVRQVRFGGIVEAGVIPEPTAWAIMIVGFAGAGAALRRQRRLAHG